MNDDLAFLKAHIGEPPSPSGAVLEQARLAAGLSVAQEVSFEPVVLQPRRRPRRRLVSLTVTLAACFAAGAVGVVVAVHPTTRTSPAGFATDAELANATSFHIGYHSADAKCPRPADDYYLKITGNPRDVPGLSPLPCRAGIAVYEQPEFGVGAVGVRWDQLGDVSTDPAQLAAQIEAHDGGKNTGNQDIVVQNAEISLYAPIPLAVRRALVEVIEGRPSVTQSDGHDALGRPVHWLLDHTGDYWLGIDPITDWEIANGSGPAATDGGGGPSKPGNLITAYDTEQPPADAFPTGHLDGTIARADGTGVDSELELTSTNGFLPIHADGGRIDTNLQPGTYTVTGTIDKGTGTLPPKTAVVPAHGTATFSETVSP